MVVLSNEKKLSGVGPDIEGMTEWQYNRNPKS